MELASYDVAALRKEVLAATARKSFGHFLALINDRYTSVRHTRAMVTHLEALERRDIEKLMIFMPPRHGKTMHASEYFPAWFLGRHPRNFVVLTSYTSDRATASSRKAREVFKSAEWPFQAGLDPTSHAVDEWRTTEGGILRATGVGGSLTGFGSDLLVIDDPIKDRVEANSPTFRQKTWEWYTEVARTRLMPRGRELIALTRWHEDDLVGRLLNSEEASRWTLLELPALAICPICDDAYGKCLENHPPTEDRLGRLPGEVLWPDSGLELPRPGVTMSTRAFLSLYQQRPTAEDGSLFKRSYFTRRYTDLPTLTRAVMWIDGAWKEGVSHDRSAFAVWGADRSDYYLVDIWASRVEYPDLRAKTLDFYARMTARLGIQPALCVEDAASGTPLVQELRRTTRIPILAVPARGSKYSRAEAIQPLFEMMKCILPDSHPQLDEWIEEHIKFDAGKHDDFVDTTAGALWRLSLPENTWTFARARN